MLSQGQETTNVHALVMQFLSSGCNFGTQYPGCSMALIINGKHLEIGNNMLPTECGNLCLRCPRLCHGRAAPSGFHVSRPCFKAPVGSAVVRTESPSGACSTCQPADSMSSHGDVSAHTPHTFPHFICMHASCSQCSQICPPLRTISIPQATWARVHYYNACKILRLVASPLGSLTTGMQGLVAGRAGLNTIPSSRVVLSFSSQFSTPERDCELLGDA